MNSFSAEGTNENLWAYAPVQASRSIIPIFFSIPSIDWFEMISQVRPNDVITSEIGWPA